MQYLILLFFTQFLSTYLWARPCGLEGSVEERARDCLTTKGNFSLIHRDAMGKEIYKDNKTGLIWGDRINFDFNHYGSLKACEEPTIHSLKLNWRLPRLDDFKLAAAHGMKGVLPNMIHTYWTSTPSAKSKRSSRRRSQVSSGAYLWDTELEVPSIGTILDGASVRCIANE
jgi:hypothetical protein